MHAAIHRRRPAEWRSKPPRQPIQRYVCQWLAFFLCNSFRITHRVPVPTPTRLATAATTRQSFFRCTTEFGQRVAC